jgi:hypothetical protein
MFSNFDFMVPIHEFCVSYWTMLSVEFRLKYGMKYEAKQNKENIWKL